MEPKVVGRYQILSEIARGGMATVYLAHDPRFNRQVAIKILPQQFTHDPMFLGRFRREAEAVASLEHQSIVPVYDYGEQEDEPYLVMRHMAGGSLASRIQQGPIPLEDVIAILKPVAAALDYAHEKGIVHRDVKPSNILFDAAGGAYLSDFGIVKLAETTASYTGSSVIGTPAYMSPEQVQGGSEIDGRSDVYSFGCVVYEMLTGQVPYKAETTTQQLMKHVLEPVPRIRAVKPDVPAVVEAVLMRAMAKIPNARYPTSGALISALEEATWSPQMPFAPHNAPGALPNVPGALPNVPAVSPGYEAMPGVPGAPGTGSTPGTPTLAEGAAGAGVYATMLPDAGPAPTEYQSIGYEPLAQPQQKKGRLGALIAVAAVVLAALLGGGGYLAWRNGWVAAPRPTETAAPTAVSAIETTATPTSTPTSTSAATSEPTGTPTLAPTSAPTAASTPPPTATSQPTQPPATQQPTATPTVPLRRQWRRRRYNPLRPQLRA